MKRPEGFDSRSARPAEQPRTERSRTEPPRAKPPRTEGSRTERSEKAPRPVREPRAPRVPRPENPAREARRVARAAARERKRFERSEVRRFTRHARNRRAAWLAVASILTVLGVLLAVAVYSPILALRTITVSGASQVDAAAVTENLGEHLGTPLALVDFDRIEEQLGGYPLIRSYVTETVPPDTLIIHIVERQAVGSVSNGDSFDLIDPAGIVLQSTPERPETVPLIVLGDRGIESAAFASVIEVLLALPEGLLAQVESISALTRDDVTFVLRGVGQSVVWGSAENSETKARALAGMIPNWDPTVAVEYDVSAPGSVVVTPR